jgi:peptidyl-prolyl cis-trans isomerase SurA
VQTTLRLTILITLLVLAGLATTACSSGGSSDAKDNTVAATVNGKNIMLADVERALNQQAGGKQSQLSQLELAQARLQILGNLMQREVMFQRAEKEKLLPTDDQITTLINQQKQQSGMTDDDFLKRITEQKLTMESLRDEARKDIAIKNLQDKYSSKIAVNDKEVEDFYNNNKQQFISQRGAALSVIIVDPADNSAQGIQPNDATSDAAAKLKIDNIYQQLKGGADFATVARSNSEDANSLLRGGDIGFFSEDGMKQAGLPKDVMDLLMGPMQVGSFTEPKLVNNRWYIFKLSEKRLQTENLTLESPGVRQQITQALTKQRQEILNGALLEVAMNEAKVVNHLAANMLANPSNLGLRPASATAAQQNAPSETQNPSAATSPGGNQSASSSPK